MNIIRPIIIVLMIIALVVGSGSPAQARGPLGRLLFGSAPASTTTNTTTAQSYSASSVTQTSGGGNSIAQQKAQQQLSEGRMRHVGGSFGAGRYEGVGFATGPNARERAISNCCYWGQKTPVDVGVACNGDTCYATVLYR